jgi:hypothetical protein
MKKSELKKLIVETLEERLHLISAEELATLVQNNPVNIEDGLKVYDYDNAEQFLRFFAKHNPDKVYKPGRTEGRYVAVVKQEEPKQTVQQKATPLSRAQQDMSVQRFYDDLKYKGD